jgi:hypothetical protein
MIWTTLYDPRRTPAHWTEIACPGEYAVVILDAGKRVPRDAEGREFATGEAGAQLWESVEEARMFAGDVVARHPELCCEIYTHEGKSGEPLDTVYNQAVRGKYEGRPYAKHDLTLLWGYIIGAKLVIIGGNYFLRGVAGLVEHRRE